MSSAIVDNKRSGGRAETNVSGGQRAGRVAQANLAWACWPLARESLGNAPFQASLDERDQACRPAGGGLFMNWARA